MKLFQKLTRTHYTVSCFKIYINSVLFYFVSSLANHTETNYMPLSKVNPKKFFKKNKLYFK